MNTSTTNNDELDCLVKSKDIISYEYSIDDNGGEVLSIKFNSGKVLRIESWIVSKSSGFTIKSL